MHESAVIDPVTRITNGVATESDGVQPGSECGTRINGEVSLYSYRSRQRKKNHTAGVVHQRDAGQIICQRGEVEGVMRAWSGCIAKLNSSAGDARGPRNISIISAG